MAAAPLDDLSRWARSSGLEILLLVTGSSLVSRLITWLRDRVTARIDTGVAPGGDDDIARSEAAKHRHAVAQVATWVVIVLLYFVTGLLVLERLGVPLTSLVAPATVAAAGLGFGAQRLVQDLLAGFFIVAERQYGYGDVIQIAPTGQTAGVTGTVEDITLRATRLRMASGEVLIIANGQIPQVINLSRDWARAVIDVAVPTDSDIAAVTEVLRTVGREALNDPGLKPLLLDEPSVMGVETIDVDSVKLRMVARTLPGRQFEVARQLRTRVAMALHSRGVNFEATSVEQAEARS
jgi:moderate conductance mechanosensitive channel